MTFYIESTDFDFQPYSVLNIQDLENDTIRLNIIDFQNDNQYNLHIYKSSCDINTEHKLKILNLRKNSFLNLISYGKLRIKKEFNKKNERILEPNKSEYKFEKDYENVSFYNDEFLFQLLEAEICNLYDIIEYRNYFNENWTSSELIWILYNLVKAGIQLKQLGINYSNLTLNDIALSNHGIFKINNLSYGYFNKLDTDIISSQNKKMTFPNYNYTDDIKSLSDLIQQLFQETKAIIIDDDLQLIKNLYTLIEDLKIDETNKIIILEETIKKIEDMQFFNSKQKKEISALTNKGIEIQLFKLEKKGKSGELRNLNHIAIIYNQGINIKKDFEKAFEFYEQAAQLGSAQAQATLALIYENGIGVIKDLTKSMTFYEQAAQQNFVQAQVNLAALYYTGECGNKDLSKAINLLEKAAQFGYAPAQFNLAAMYFTGNGIQKNVIKAIRLLEEAANQGLAQAQFNLSNIYMNGYDVVKNPTKAFHLLEQAANNGFALAQFNLGLIYYNGENIEKNLLKAIILYEKAAIQGHLKAQTIISRIYHIHSSEIQFGIKSFLLVLNHYL